MSDDYRYQLRPGSDDWLNHEGLCGVFAQKFVEQWPSTIKRYDEVHHELMVKVWLIQEAGTYTPDYCVSTYLYKALSRYIGREMVVLFIDNGTRSKSPERLNTRSLDYEFEHGDTMYSMVPGKEAAPRVDVDTAVDLLTRVVDEIDAGIVNHYVKEQPSMRAARKTVGKSQWEGETNTDFTDRLSDYARVAEWLYPEETARAFGELANG